MPMNAKDLRAMNDDQLVVELRKLGEDLFNLRFQHATGELENTARLGLVKRDLARAYTVVRERGLRVDPTVVHH